MCHTVSGGDRGPGDAFNFITSVFRHRFVGSTSQEPACNYSALGKVVNRPFYTVYGSLITPEEHFVGAYVQYCTTGGHGVCSEPAKCTV